MKQKFKKKSKNSHKNLKIKKIYEKSFFMSLLKTKKNLQKNRVILFFLKIKIFWTKNIDFGQKIDVYKCSILDKKLMFTNFRF